MKVHYEMKVQYVGPGPEDVLKTAYLNRTLEWHEDGLKWTPHKRHLDKLVEVYGLDNANTVGTPLTPESTTTGTTKKLTGPAAKNFRSAAARLNYLAQDRPDIAVAACTCATRMSAPEEADEVLMKRVVKYLRRYPAGTMLYAWQDLSDDMDTLCTMTDSDWASCSKTRRSKSGGLILRGHTLFNTGAGCKSASH